MQMRIGSYTQIQQVYNMTQTSKTKGTSKKGFSDAVSISGTGKDMQTVKSALESIADIRSGKVDSLKAQIAAGSYDVSADDFANKLVEKFMQGGLTL